MVNIRYLTKKGDSVSNVKLTEAQEILEKEIEHGNVVFDEDERKIVTKATLGKIDQNGNLAVFPKIQGG